jgi:DNA replicative helicase MCM subunit Mcm2 (Cdc46/Mcm family)
VLSVHQRAGTVQAADCEESADEKWLSRYIAYCRSHCFPRLTDEARRELRGKYVDIRDRVSCI